MGKYTNMYGAYDEKLDRAELDYPGGPEEALDCDIAIIGGGGSGASAAVRAAELGAKVIVVEKMDALGGHAWYAGGLLSTNSRFQKELGLPDTTNDYIKTAYQKHRYLLDARIFKRYISHSGRYLEWLVDHGLDITNTRWGMNGSVCMIRDRLEPGPLNNPWYGPGLMGSSVLNVLKKSIESLNVPILLRTKVSELTMDASGTVVGLRADGQGKCYKINAKAVILSTGGFGGNREMLEKYYPQYFSSGNDVTYYSMKFIKGDGLGLAEKTGAEIGKDMSIYIEPLTHIPGAYSTQCVIRQPICLIVNKRGERFIAEDDRDAATYTIDIQPEGIAFCVVDNDVKLEALEMSAQNPFGDPIATPEELERDLQAESAEGRVFIADTIEELARLIGAEPSVLLETIDRYNAYCDKGIDGELVKAPENLRPIRKAPFYALRLARKYDVTMGGVSVNHKLEAVGPDRTPIPGFYATGDIAGGWMGPEYAPMFSSFCWALNSGFFAAEEAVKTLRERG